MGTLTISPVPETNLLLVTVSRLDCVCTKQVREYLALLLFVFSNQMVLSAFNFILLD